MRYAVTYRIDGGKCQTGFAVQTCDGAKVYATATGGEPIAGAVVVPFEQCPDEVFVVNQTGGGHPAEPVGRKVSTIWFSQGIVRYIQCAKTTKSIRIQFLSAGTLVLPRTDVRNSYEMLQVPAGFIYEADAGDADYLDLAGVQVDADAIATFTSTGLVETEVVLE